MMTGMMLTLSGLLLGLFGSSVAAAFGGEAAPTALWPWLLVPAALVVVSVLFATRLGNQGKTDRPGQPDRQKVSAAVVSGQQRSKTDLAPHSDAQCEKILEQHIRQCATQADALAVMSISLEQADVEHQADIARSLHGLAQSRGARLVQSLSRGVMVIAPGQLLDDAERLAEDLHQSVVSIALPSKENPLGVVTASIGVVVTQPTPRTAAAEILATLSQAVKLAEGSGGNRIEILES